MSSKFWPFMYSLMLVSSPLLAADPQPQNPNVLDEDEEKKKKALQQGEATEDPEIADRDSQRPTLYDMNQSDLRRQQRNNQYYYQDSNQNYYQQQQQQNSPYPQGQGNYYYYQGQ